MLEFSSPIFGDMFLLDERLKELTELGFSSPIFGDMFLLRGRKTWLILQ